jgi:ribosomal protein L11 methyltransferase
VSTTWSVTAEIPAPSAEEATVLLFERGASGVEEREPGVLAMPGARAPAPGCVLVVAYFEHRGGAEAGVRVLEALGAAAEIEEIAPRDWGEEWKKGLSPFSVGRVFLRPSWLVAAPPPGAAEVVLDPGMAFGTGTHPTTALCLAAVDAFLASRPGASVLDVGTGSGILAIAARKLGAGRVAANDEDPVAVEVARENAARNAVTVEITGAALSTLAGPFDLVVANILANVLVQLAPALAGRVASGGELVLAGVLGPQEEEVRAPFLALGLTPLEGARRGEWSLLRFRRGE